MWLLVVAFILAVLVHRLKLNGQPRRPPAVVTQSNVDATTQLKLCRDSRGNEALVVAARLARRFTLFQVDTGYAGPPVVSTSYLSVSSEVDERSIESEYAAASSRVKRRITDDQRQRAINHLLQEGLCRAFTSGCTMRLMGIGTTSEMQADMLLCPGISFSEVGRSVPLVDADVLVTHPLKGGIHILTCDYLLHRHPCILSPADETLSLSISNERRIAMEPAFDFHAAYFVGGAFSVMMHVGGTQLRIVVDTGAAAPLSLGTTASKKIKTCKPPSRGHFHVTQTGVNGESVCSSAFVATVKIGALEIGEVHVMANGDEVEGADGYAGIGLLRAVDMWLEPTRIGFRKNRLDPTMPNIGQPGKCSVGGLPTCAE